MVVGNNYIKPHPLCLLNLRQGGNSTINGNNQANALSVESFQSGCFKSIALCQAMWYVWDSVAAKD
ncbi:hypothetical protein ES703_22612 [subsurface metagenome]